MDPGEAKSSIESPRVTSGSPRKRWLEARRKSSRSLLCAKDNIPGVCVISLLEESSTSMWKLYRDFWVVSASKLWLAQLLQTSSDECAVSRGRTADGRVKVECLLQFCFFYRVRCRLAAPPYHQLSPASVRRFLLQKS